MINEHERRILEAMEQQLTSEDPRLARQLAGARRPRRARTAVRAAFAPSVMVAVGVLAIILFVVHLSALGILLVLWLLAGWAHHFVRPQMHSQEPSSTGREHPERGLPPSRP